MLKPAHGAEKDIEMMSAHGDWPRWPRLPVKRTNPNPELGFSVQVGCMMAVEGHLNTVFLVSLFEDINVDETEKIVYQDKWAIQDAGWVVD